MTSNEQLIEFFREFILSVIDHGDLDLFLETMSEEVDALIPPAGEKRIATKRRIWYTFLKPG